MKPPSVRAASSAAGWSSAKPLRLRISAARSLRGLGIAAPMPRS